MSSGDLTYVDAGPYRPLRLTDINLKASNIRNIRYPDQVYPSPVSLTGKIFDKGSLKLDGNANFLEEPHFGVKAMADLKDVDVSYFQPLTAHANVSIKKGTADASGYFEYSPKITSVNLRTLNIHDAGLEYVHLPSTKETEKQRVRKAGQTAKELSNKSSTQVRIDLLRIAGSSFSYVNKTSKPNYRIFIEQIDATLKNFSNQFSEGTAELRLTGQFMGTGNTNVVATFRSETKSPDFTIRVAIVNTQMPAMSDLFEAYGDFDIKSRAFLILFRA